MSLQVAEVVGVLVHSEEFDCKLPLLEPSHLLLFAHSQLLFDLLQSAAQILLSLSRGYLRCSSTPTLHYLNEQGFVFHHELVISHSGLFIVILVFFLFDQLLI